MTGSQTFVHTAKTSAMTSQLAGGFIPDRTLTVTNKQLHKERNQKKKKSRHGFLLLKTLPA